MTRTSRRGLSLCSRAWLRRPCPPRAAGGRLRSCPPRRASPAAPPLLRSGGHPPPLAIHHRGLQTARSNAATRSRRRRGAGVELARTHDGYGTHRHRPRPDRRLHPADRSVSDVRRAPVVDPKRSSLIEPLPFTIALHGDLLRSLGRDEPFGEIGNRSVERRVGSLSHRFGEGRSIFRDEGKRTIAGSQRLRPILGRPRRFARRLRRRAARTRTQAQRRCDREGRGSHRPR